jgi:hypothetical protein
MSVGKTVRGMKWTVSTVLVFLGGAPVTVACNDPGTREDGCYAKHVSLDQLTPDTHPDVLLLHATGCEWAEIDANHPFGLPLPPPPDDRYGQMWGVVAAFEVTDNDPCDPCDVERLDALLRARIDETCGMPYDHFTRGCYATPEETNTNYCSVAAIYASDCNPHESH